MFSILHWFDISQLNYRKCFNCVDNLLPPDFLIHLTSAISVSFRGMHTVKTAMKQIKVIEILFFFCTPTVSFSPFTYRAEVEKNKEWKGKKI